MPAMDRNGADRKLHEAAGRSPELAAMLLANRHDDPSSRYRRIAFIVAVAALGTGLLWLVAPRLSRPKPHETAEMDFSVYLPPITTQKAAGGEETSPFTGFAVSIETDPAGAVVTIGGVVRGEAPVLANVTCRATEKVEVRADRPGFRPVRRQVACRPDTLVKLTLQLEP